MNEEPLIIWLIETKDHNKFVLVDRMDEEKYYGIKFYFRLDEFFVDFDYWDFRCRVKAYPITTERDKYFVREGLVQLFHDAKR